LRYCKVLRCRNRKFSSSGLGSQPIICPNFKGFSEHSRLATDLHSQGIQVFYTSRSIPLFLRPGCCASPPDVSIPLQKSPQTIKTKNHIKQEFQVATAAYYKIDCFFVFTMFNPPARDFSQSCQFKFQTMQFSTVCQSSEQSGCTMGICPYINASPSLNFYYCYSTPLGSIHKNLRILSFQDDKTNQSDAPQVQTQRQQAHSGKGQSSQSHSSWQAPETTQARVSRSSGYGRRV
jgi:hypothetical protein